MAYDDDWDGTKAHNQKLSEIDAAVMAERERCAVIAQSAADELFAEINRYAGTDRADDGTLSGRAGVALGIANEIRQDA